MKKKLTITIMSLTLAASLCACTDTDVTGKVKELMAIDVTIDASCMNETENAVKNALETAELAKTDSDEPGGAETEAAETITEEIASAKDPMGLNMASEDKEPVTTTDTYNASAGASSNTAAGVNTKEPSDAPAQSGSNTTQTANNNTGNAGTGQNNNAATTTKPEKPADTATTKPAETAKNEPAPAQPAQTPDKPASQPTQEYTPTITMNGNDTNVTNWTDEQKQAHDQNTLDAIGDAIMTSGAEAGNDVATDMGLTGSCTMQ